MEADLASTIVPLYEEYWGWEPNGETHQGGKPDVALHTLAFELAELVRTYAHQGLYVPPGPALSSRIERKWCFCADTTPTQPHRQCGQHPAVSPFTPLWPVR